MKNLVLFILLLTLAIYPAHAAFVIKKIAPAAPQTENTAAVSPVKKDGQPAFLARLTKKLPSSLIHPKPPFMGDNRHQGGWLGITSLCSGVGALGVFLLLFTPIILPAMIGGTVAVLVVLTLASLICGGSGLTHKYRGLAIAGLVLGILLALPVLITIIVALLLLI